jgi:hypothetical protein
MKQLTVIRAALLVVFSGVLLSYLALKVPSIRAMTALSFTPYTITYREIVTNPQGIAVSNKEFLEVQRSDGDQATVLFQTPDHSKDYLRIINLHSKGITVNTNTYNSYKYTMGKGSPVTRRHPDAECREDISREAERLGSETMFGFKVLHFKESEAMSETENWMAPGLGCVLLKTVTSWKKSDGTLDGQSTYLKEAVQVIAADPSDELFVFPKGNEVSPSQYRAAIFPSRPPSPSLPKIEARYASDKAARAQLGLEY